MFFLDQMYRNFKKHDTNEDQIQEEEEEGAILINKSQKKTTTN